MATLWKKLSRVVNRVEGFLMIWLLLIFGALLMVNVVLRKFNLSGLSWSICPFPSIYICIDAGVWSGLSRGANSERRSAVSPRPGA